MSADDRHGDHATRTSDDRTDDDHPASGGPPDVALRWWRELLIAGGFYLVYSVVRNTFGAGSESRTIAFRHARNIIKIEDTLGLWFEPELQRWYLDLPAHGFIRAWNIFYGTAHFVVTIGVLVYAFRKAPAVYRFARTMLAATTSLALIGFAAFTLMPPRLLDVDSEFGACRGQGNGCHGYGIVDTIDRWGGMWKFGKGGMAAVSNQYAAMPSLHFGWSTWCAITVVLVVGAGRRRWLAFLYPAVTLFCILVTGNHFWLDAFFGGLALLAGWAVATGIERVRSRRATVTGRQLATSRSSTTDPATPTASASTTAPAAEPVDDASATSPRRG